MAIYKNKDIETNINERGAELGNINVNFYTEDKSTSSIRITIKNNKRAVDLSKTNLTPKLDLFHSDGSIFMDENINTVLPEQGIIQYKISDQVIKHPGTVKAKLFLKNETESVHVANFNFTIKDSGITEAVSKEITVNIVDDSVRRIIQENAIELLGQDFKQRLNDDVVTHLESKPELFKGPKGSTGPQGPKGEQGIQGPKGDALKYTDLSTSEKEELKSNITNQAITDFVLEDNSISNEKLVDNAITPEKTTFFDVNKSKNLLNPSTVQRNKTVDTDGSIIEDSVRWLSDFIHLDELNGKINFTQGVYRISLYKEDKTFIVRTGVSNSTSYTPKASPKAKYVRISGIIEPSTVMVNTGDSLLPFENHYNTQIKLKQEFLPLQSDDNNFSGTLLPSDLAKIEQNIQTYTPSIPKLEFEEVTTGYYEALWLSEDGKRIYGKHGARLWVSYDECKTFTTIINNTGISVQAVRELEDGELIFSIERDTVNRTQNGRVFKTKGFDKETGNIDSYELKVETPSTEAKINNSWGITSYKNVVTLSEYGLKTEEGARRAWLSTDYGETFKVVFDQKETTKLIEGAPVWTETAHMHTCSFDPYWNRIWIVTGDRPNSATYYSDDFGETWKWVDVQFNNDTMQFTGILALPNCVIFGSDRAPNGVFVYYRGSKSDTPVIQPLLLVNNSDKISHVFQIPFKRNWDSLTPVYFSAPNAGDTDNKSLCVATVDGKKAFILHENNIDEKFGGKCLTFLGDTTQGNIIGTFFDSDISGYRIGKAKAPEWTKM